VRALLTMKFVYRHKFSLMKHSGFLSRRFLKSFMSFMLEEKHSPFISDHHIREFFVADKSGNDLGSDTGVIVDQLGNEIGFSL